MKKLHINRWIICVVFCCVASVAVLRSWGDTAQVADSANAETDVEAAEPTGQLPQIKPCDCEDDAGNDGVQPLTLTPVADGNGSAIVSDSGDADPTLSDYQPIFQPVQRESSLFASPRHALLFRGASTLVEGDDSVAGGLIGSDLFVKLGGGWGAFGSINANFVEEGTQVLGTVGIFRTPLFYTDGPLPRFGWAVLFDQLTDTRFNSPYIAQMRARVGYSPRYDLTIGGIYNESIADDGVSIATANFGTQTITVRPSTAYGGYVSGWLGNAFVNLTGEVQYLDDFDAMVYGGSARFPVSDRLNVYATASYDDSDLWAGSLGIEFSFGGPRQCNCSGGMASAPVPGYPSGSQQEVVRGVGPLLDDSFEFSNDTGEFSQVSELNPMTPRRYHENSNLNPITLSNQFNQQFGTAFQPSQELINLLQRQTSNRGLQRALGARGNIVGNPCGPMQFSSDGGATCQDCPPTAIGVRDTDGDGIPDECVFF